MQVVRFPSLSLCFVYLVYGDATDAFCFKSLPRLHPPPLSSVPHHTHIPTYYPKKTVQLDVPQGRRRGGGGGGPARALPVGALAWFFVVLVHWSVGVGLVGGVSVCPS
jgi:hypothetical protein